jgi:hypothetical protein
MVKRNVSKNLGRPRLRLLPVRPRRGWKRRKPEGPEPRLSKIVSGGPLESVRALSLLEIALEVRARKKPGAVRATSQRCGLHEGEVLLFSSATVRAGAPVHDDMRPCGASPRSFRIRTATTGWAGPKDVEGIELLQGHRRRPRHTFQSHGRLRSEGEPVDREHYDEPRAPRGACRPWSTTAPPKATTSLCSGRCVTWTRIGCSDARVHGQQSLFVARGVSHATRSRTRPESRRRSRAPRARPPPEAEDMGSRSVRGSASARHHVGGGAGITPRITAPKP